ncbi:MAG: hypothetical protein KJS91_09020 [Planctomycetes bacterium]|nr:hypothetical protein [Planctomycetota bacterium]
MTDSDHGTPTATLMDLPSAGFRSGQRGLFLGLALMAGLPPWLAPPLLAAMLASLSWRESGSKGMAFQAAADGALGGLTGLWISFSIAHLLGSWAYPAGMAAGSGLVGVIFASIEYVAFGAKYSETQASNSSGDSGHP